MSAADSPAAAAVTGADPAVEPLAAVDDAALVAAALAGRAAAFERLMRRHNRLLFRAARGVLDDDADAEDAVQEAWLLAFTRLSGFRGEAALPTWLARIAINAALDLRRRQGRGVPLDATIDPEADPPVEQMMAFQLPADAAPESMAQRGQMRALLERAVAALPPLYRTVFMLRSVHELTVEEAAQALGVSAEVVKTRHLRARALLRDALGAQLEGSIAEAFAFDGARCDRVVAAVLAQLQRRDLIRPG